MVTCKISAAVVKKLTNYEHLARSKTKKSKPKLLQGFISPVHFVVAMENTLNPRRQVMTKNKTFPLNHSLACASYAIYVAIHTCKCKESKKKNRKRNDEKGG